MPRHTWIEGVGADEVRSRHGEGNAGNDTRQSWCEARSARKVVSQPRHLRSDPRTVHGLPEQTARSPAATASCHQDALTAPHGSHVGSESRINRTGSPLKPYMDAATLMIIAGCPELEGQPSCRGSQPAPTPDAQRVIWRKFASEASSASRGGTPSISYSRMYHSMPPTLSAASATPSQSI
jgi:hypothetical protein